MTSQTTATTPPSRPAPSWMEWSQHPHDLFMEVAALYKQGLGDDLALQLYVAPAGEPALGPFYGERLLVGGMVSLRMAVAPMGRHSH